MKKLIFITFISLIFISWNTVAAETYTNVVTKDGKTFITTKTIEGDKITIEQKIYDADGNLLDTKITVKDAPPPREKEVTYPVEKQVTPATTKPLPTKTIPTPTVTEVGGENGVEVVKVTSRTSSFIQTAYPTYVSTESGNLVVQTSAGDKELKISPDKIMDKARTAGMNLIGSVNLEGEADNLKYKVKGNKIKKLFGFYEIYINTNLVYDTQSGNLIKVEQSTWAKLADRLSI
jgi:hypothetical protein